MEGGMEVVAGCVFLEAAAAVGCGPIEAVSTEDGAGAFPIWQSRDCNVKEGEGDAAHTHCGAGAGFLLSTRVSGGGVRAQAETMGGKMGGKKRGKKNNHEQGNKGRPRRQKAWHPECGVS